MRNIDKEFGDLERWTRGMDRMLGSLFLREAASNAWRPPTDVFETPDAVVIKVEIAGMRPEDFEIIFSDRILQIRGARQDPQTKVKSHCLEIQYGEFVSEVYLPGTYAEERIQAKYEEGYLTIELPKVKPEPRNVSIMANL